MKFFKTDSSTISNQFKNKKWLAWVALISTIMVMFSVLFCLDDGKIKVVSGIIQWFFTLMASIIGAYVGFSTWQDVSEMKCASTTIQKSLKKQKEIDVVEPSKEEDKFKFKSLVFNELTSEERKE